MNNETLKECKAENEIGMPIILGSKSGGRKEILKQMGYKFEVMSADIDENAIRFEDPATLTLALARAKAEALLPKIDTDAILITSDQVVACNGKIIEKPSSEREAREFFKMYEGHPLETVTSVVVINTKTGARGEGTDIAKLSFSFIPPEVINDYIATQEPFRCAGGFDHKNPMISEYIKITEGESESISGLPKTLTKKLIEKVK